MPRANAETLSQLVRAAEGQVTVGDSYVHFKHPERAYRVLTIAIAEATEEIVVVYKALYGEQLTFSRLLSSWLDEVVWEGKTVPRFRKV